MGNCFPWGTVSLVPADLSPQKILKIFEFFGANRLGGLRGIPHLRLHGQKTPTNRAGSKAKQSFSRPSTFQQRKKGQNMFQHEKKPGHFRDGGVISGILVPSLIHSKRQNGVFQLSFSTPFHGDSFPVGGVGPGRKAACPTPPAGTPVASAGGV